MKNYLLLLFILFTLTVWAQPKIGARGGVNFSNQKIKIDGSTDTGDIKTGLMGGLYIEANVSNKFAVQPEILFSSMGTSDNDSEITVPFSYLSLPVLLRYNLTPKFNIHAGPQFGVLLSAKINDGSSSVNIKENYKGTEWGASFGVGSQFGKFDIGARYYLGLSNIQDNTTLIESCKNSGLQVFMGYRLSEVFED